MIKIKFNLMSDASLINILDNNNFRRYYNFYLLFCHNYFLLIFTITKTFPVIQGIKGNADRLIMCLNATLVC